MMDLINGSFEFIGACLICLSIRRLYYDRQVRGVSLWPVTFFSIWGFWNIAFYSHLDQWISFSAGLFMVTVNVVWLVQMAWYTTMEVFWGHEV